MPDSVENLGDSAPAQTEATPSTNGAEPGGRKGPRNGFESRIAELVQQKHEINRQWQSKYDDLLGEIDSIKKQISEKSGSRENHPPAKSPIFSGFEQMSSEDIDGVLAQGPQDNAAFYASVLRESQRRYGEELLNKASKQQSEQQKKAFQQQKAWGEIKARFGPDLDNPKSELRERAERYMAQLRREEGEQVVNDMNAQYRCVAAAHHDLHAQDAEELQTQRREVERLKQVQAMGTGVKSAMRLNDKVEEALKRAGQTSNANEHRAAIKSALKNLEIVQGTREP